MKILIINDYDYEKGGAQVYDHKLKNMLEEQGYEVVYFGGKEKGWLLNFFSSVYSRKHNKEINEILDGFAPDVVFAHAVGSNISSQVFSMIHKRDIPICLKMANLSIYDWPKITLKKLCWVALVPRTLLHRFIIKRCVDVFLAPSETTEKWLKQQLGITKNRIRLIRNPSFFPAAEKPRVTQGEKTILFVGRLTKNKGVEYLIKAFEQINGARLEIVGEGKNMDSLVKLVKSKNMGGKVSLMGNLPTERVKEEYYNAYAFVLPSIIEENSPLTIREAMSQGTPVITTNIGGQAELVQDGETGFLVNPKSYADLTEKIKIILRDNNLQKKMAEECLSRAKRSSPEKHFIEIQDLLGSLAQKKIY
ncbi:MAG: glycosyltransferase family 4 protein [Candidatus Diapherotrites archaeon]|nr:glycosyltransferase family 4 protein [Candidatus Diapherotrites archaeon]